MSLHHIARLPRFLAARAVDAGWARGSSDFTRFVVLGWYRTGSNLLLSLLNSDASVVAYSEVFSPRGLFWGNRVHAPWDRGGDLERRRTADAPAFLEEVVFRRHARSVRAVGFKLFYPQLVVRPVAGLAEALVSTPGLRVVHLRRRNLLRVLVSNRIANRTGQMAATSPAAAREAQSRVGTLRLEPEDCESYFTLLEERAERCHALFDEESVLSLEYEALVADRDAELGRVRAFLGLPPADGSTRLVKQGTRALADVLENLEELREHFRGSRWEAFFEE